MSRLVIAEKPSVAQSIASVLGAGTRKDGYLEGGGYLVSCSCSQHVTPDIFMGILREAAYETRKRIRLVDVRTQGRDHPILIASEETQYLKCVIMQVFG